MAPLFSGKSEKPILPETLQEPHLCHPGLFGFVIPSRPQLLTTAVDLVTLCLTMADPSTYFPVPSHDVERQLLRMPVPGHLILLNLRHFRFRGGSAYLEALVGRISSPRLQKL